MEAIQAHPPNLFQLDERDYQEEAMARTATIGPAIYEQVGKLVAGGKTRTQAFAQVAKERKSSPGTVSANYYRVARQQGQGRKRAAGGRGRRQGSKVQRGIYAAQQNRDRRTSAADGDIRQTANQISQLIQQLVNQVEHRDKRIRELLD
jgi:hypothetical protein